MPPPTLQELDSSQPLSTGLASSAQYFSGTPLFFSSSILPQLELSPTVSWGGCCGSSSQAVSWNAWRQLSIWFLGNSTLGCLDGIRDDGWWWCQQQQRQQQRHQQQDVQICTTPQQDKKNNDKTIRCAEFALGQNSPWIGRSRALRATQNSMGRRSQLPTGTEMCKRAASFDLFQPEG